MVRIAAWPTAIESYRILCRAIGEFLYRCGAWMACLLVLVLAKMLPWPAFISWLLVIATVLCAGATAASLGVGWCRLILRDETSDFGVVTLTFGRRELRALSYLAAVALLPAVPLTLLALLVGAQSWWAPAFALIARGPLDLTGLLLLSLSLIVLLALLVASLVASARLLIVLPAVALDEPGYQFPVVWRHSRDSVWPLFFGWLVCLLPTMLPWAILSIYLYEVLGAWLAVPLIELLAYPMGLIAVTLSAGFFCYVYAQFVDAPSVAGAVAEDAPSVA